MSKAGIKGSAALLAIGVFAWFAGPAAQAGTGESMACNLCHAAGASTTISVTQGSVSSGNVSYSVSGSSASRTGWGAYNSGGTKVASGSGSGTLTLPRNNSTYTVYWVAYPSSKSTTIQTPAPATTTTTAATTTTTRPPTTTTTAATTTTTRPATTTTTVAATTTTRAATTTTTSAPVTTTTIPSVTTTTLPVSGDITIIDNSDQGADKQFTVITGAWRIWRGMNKDFGPNCAYARSTRWSTSASARWTTNALPAGTYNVFARWPSSDKLSHHVPYTIKDGSTILATVRVNQAGRAGQWVRLGTFNFSAGGHTVEISNSRTGTLSTEHDLYVCADAVRFIPTTLVQPPTPPATTGSDDEHEDDEHDD